MKRANGSGSSSAGATSIWTASRASCPDAPDPGSDGRRPQLMRYLPEALTSRLVSHELATDAVAEALICAAGEGSNSFPAVLGHALDPGNRFSLKAASTAEVAGLKVGSYWAGNPDLG